MVQQVLAHNAPAENPGSVHSIHVSLQIPLQNPSSREFSPCSKLCG